MATFQSRIEALTGISLSTTSTPTLAEAGQFLVDGVIDYQSKYLNLFPGEGPKFSRESSEYTSNNADLNGANVLTVVRESGSDGDWRVCRQSFPGMESMIKDKRSVHYASKINPAFVQLGDIISVYPEPGSNPGEAYKIYYVNNAPVNSDGSTLSATDSSIAHFPDNKEQLIIIYASAKVLEAKMLDYTIEEEDTELMQALGMNLQLLQQQYFDALVPSGGRPKE